MYSRAFVCTSFLCIFIPCSANIFHVHNIVIGFFRLLFALWMMAFSYPNAHFESVSQVLMDEDLPSLTLSNSIHDEGVFYLEHGVQTDLNTDDKRTKDIGLIFPELVSRSTQSGGNFSFNNENIDTKNKNDDAIPFVTYEPLEEACVETLKEILIPKMIIEIKHTTEKSYQEAFRKIDQADDENEQEDTAKLVMVLKTNRHSQMQPQQKHNAEKANEQQNTSAYDKTNIVNQIIDEQTATAVAWNANGSVIAVADGHFDHEGWCEHTSNGQKISFWNIFRRNVDAEKPDVHLEVPGCCQALAFHPEKHTIIAGGMFDGRIIIWNYVLQKQFMMESESSDYTHREPITKLAWIKDTSTKQWLLASIAGDGKVLFWSMDNKLQLPVEGFLLRPNNMYHGHGNALKANDSVYLGGTTFAFSTDGFTYVVGTEGGGILRCQQPSRSRLKKNKLLKSGEFQWTREAYRLYDLCTAAASRSEVKRAIELYARNSKLTQIAAGDIIAAKPSIYSLFRSPIDSAFEPHDGPVYSIAFNPANPNLFLSCSIDGTIKFFNTRVNQPLIQFEPSSHALYDVAWSPCRPVVFAAADSIGQVFIYDISKSMIAPVLTLPPHSGRHSIAAIAFNKEEPDLLASLDISGRVQIWRLSSRLGTLHMSDAEVIARIAAIGMSADKVISGDSSLTSMKSVSK